MCDTNCYRKQDEDYLDYTDSFEITEIFNTVYEDEDKAEGIRVVEDKRKEAEEAKKAAAAKAKKK